MIQNSGLFYMSSNMAMSFQNLMLKVNYFSLKGLSGFILFFCKMLELFSERCRWRWLTATSKGLFFLKIALLANASPSKLIRLQAGTSASRLQVLMQISLYPHWLKPPPPGLFLYPPQPGGSDPTPRAISKTDGRSETDEAAFERSRQDASKPLLKI